MRGGSSRSRKRLGKRGRKKQRHKVARQRGTRKENSVLHHVGLKAAHSQRQAGVKARSKHTQQHPPAGEPLWQVCQAAPQAGAGRGAWAAAAALHAPR